MSEVATYYLLAFAVSLALTPICRHFARNLGFVAQPKLDRWHKNPTALFGGVAITVTAIAFGVFSGPDLRLWQLLGCGLLISAFGLIDDLLTLKPSTKLIAQVSIASALVFFGYRLGWTDSMVGDAMLTLFWIVGITNSFNLLDNMDGLCAGIVVIAGTFLFAGLWANSGASPNTLYLSVLLGATSGFLVYNIHPASIFMGDAGSLFLGFNLAALTLTAQGGGHPATSDVLPVIAGPVLLLLIPIFDTTLVTVMRIASGRRPSQGGRDHSSHRLVALGLPEPTAVKVLWTLAALGGAIALSLQMGARGWPGTIALIFLIAMVIFAVHLARIRVYDVAEVDQIEGKVTPLLVDFMYKRRVAEVVLDVCIIPISYYSAYRLRFEGEALTIYYPFFLDSLPIVLVCQLLSLFVIGGYRGTWRYFGLMDAVVFVKGVLLGTAASIVVIVFTYNFANYSRSVFVIYAALLILLLAGTRASFRLVGEFISRRQAIGRRCLIYGTTGAGLATVREAFGPQLFRILGFAEDDPSQMNSRVSGYPVLGDFQCMLSMIEASQVDCIILNTRIPDLEKVKRLQAVCRARDVDLMTLHVRLEPINVAS